MEDLPAQVGRAKPQSSMHIGTQLVKDGAADGFVSAGNTGAALAISTLHTLKRIPKVKRPMLAAIAPLSLHHPRRLVMSDIGANTDCRPEWLLQFAQMSHSYAKHVLKNPSPRVGLLSNGEEEIKGNELTRQAYTLLKASGMNFVGNVEAKDVLIQGSVDVLVFDGFAGNVFMKTVEATASGMGQLIRKEIKKKPLTALGGLLARPAFERIRKLNDPFEIGGTLLLGVQGVVIIAHGRTNALGIKNSVRMAREAVQADLVSIIEASIQD
jgi:glycerol-3-phosphate acyltransferase PlsX